MKVTYELLDEHVLSCGEPVSTYAVRDRDGVMVGVITVHTHHDGSTSECIYTLQTSSQMQDKGTQKGPARATNEDHLKAVLRDYGLEPAPARKALPA